MRRILTAVFLTLALSHAAPADPAAIRGVITDQIEAFKRDDFTQAFTHASPSIKGMFGTPERFGQMVRNGYPMVWRPREVRFLDLREEDGRVLQRIVVTDQAGGEHILEYAMIETENGWQINGVTLLRGLGLAA